MANMIKFYRGLVNSLPTTGENGALYITTDEGAIYYGTGTGMKRLGDFVQVDAVANLPAKAHEGCLYYCVAENILAKWNGSEWKQINKQPTAEEMKTLLGLGSMAYKSEVTEGDLSTELAEKVNAASEGNHAHLNKTVLDGITAEKVTAWDAAESNAKGHADGLNTAMNTRVEALETAIGENGSVATQIKTAIEALDYTDTAVDGEYVSAVNEVDGKISVTRKALPDYSNTYDAKGAAATALDNAKAYADGLAANYDEKGAAAGVKTELEAEIAKKVTAVEGKDLIATSEITRLAGMSDGANKVEASENGKIKIDGVDTVVYTHPDKHVIADVDGLQDALDGKQAAGNYSVEGHKHVKADITDFAHTHVAADVTDLDATIKGYDYATKTEAEGYANAKDEAIAAAQKTADDITTYVGTFTASEGVDTVVKYIDAKTANIASDETVSALAGKVEQAEQDIEALETESAKHAIKTEVEGALALKADKTALEATDKTLAEVKATVDNFFAEDAAINDTIDTLKEIANYIATDKEGAADITARVGALEGKVDVDKVSEAIDADVKVETDRATAAESALSGRIDTLEAIDHDAYKAADATLKSELQAEIDADVKALADGAVAKNAEDIATKANSADVYAKTETYNKTEIEALFTWGEF